MELKTYVNNISKIRIYFISKSRLICKQPVILFHHIPTVAERVSVRSFQDSTPTSQLPQGRNRINQPSFVCNTLSFKPDVTKSHVQRLQSLVWTVAAMDLPNCKVKDQYSLTYSPVELKQLNRYHVTSASSKYKLQHKMLMLYDHPEWKVLDNFPLSKVLKSFLIIDANSASFCFLLDSI